MIGNAADHEGTFVALNTKNAPAVISPNPNKCCDDNFCLKTIVTITANKISVRAIRIVSSSGKEKTFEPIRIAGIAKAYSNSAIAQDIIMAEKTDKFSTLRWKYHAKVIMVLATASKRIGKI